MMKEENQMCSQRQDERKKTLNRKIIHNNIYIYDKAVSKFFIASYVKVIVQFALTDWQWYGSFFSVLLL